MYCPKCGTQNAEDAAICASCGSVLAAGTAGASVQVKVSRLAITAFVLGLVSLFTFGLTVIPAIIVGIIALSVISRSGGRLTGQGFAIVGIVVPVVSLAFFGLLMVTRHNTREHARFMVCRSNLRQYVIVQRMYAEDNRGSFPNASDWLFRNGGSNCDWHNPGKNLEYHPELAGLLWAYLKYFPHSHVCPTLGIVVRARGCGTCGGQTIPVIPRYGYTMNAYLNADASTAATIPAPYRTSVSGDNGVRKESQVKRPAETFYFGEENTWVTPGLNNGGMKGTNLCPLPDRSADSFATFHKVSFKNIDHGVSNASFVDGHTQKVNAWGHKARETWELAWPGAKPAPIF